MRTRWQRLGRMARAQHSLITRNQARRCGLTDSAIKRWVAAGKLDRVHAGVYRVAGAARSWEQELMAAVLAAGPGAVASHRAAARLWGMLDHAPVEVAVAHGRSARLGDVIVHSSRDLPSGFTTRRHGIPCTNPMLTLADLGAVLPRHAVEDALNSCLASRLLSIPAVERVLDEIARPGRRGAGVLRSILDDLALASARPPDSVLEARMGRLFRRYGLPPATFQHEIRVAARRFRLDYAYVDSLLAIEVKGWKFHGTPAQQQADYEREALLTGKGWRILSFTWRDVVRRPKWVADRVLAALDAILVAQRPKSQPNEGWAAAG